MVYVRSPSGLRKLIIALAMVAILLSTAYIASILLHDRLVPEEKGPSVLVVVSMEQKNSGIPSWTDESERLTVDVDSEVNYNFGIRMKGLRDAQGIVLSLNISRPGISATDVTALWFNEDANTWTRVVFIDQGDKLIGVIGPAGGQDVDQEFNYLTILLITSQVSGDLTFEGYGR